MTDKEFWTRVFLSLVKLGSETTATSGSAAQIVLVAAAMADAALVEFRKRFGEAEQKPAIKRHKDELLARKLELERDKLAQLDRLVAGDSPQIAECKAEIARLEAMLKGA